MMSNPHFERVRSAIAPVVEEKFQGMTSETRRLLEQLSSMFVFALQCIELSALLPASTVQLISHFSFMQDASLHSAPIH
jgi:hypothetical protein